MTWIKKVRAHRRLTFLLIGTVTVLIFLVLSRQRMAPLLIAEPNTFTRAYPEIDPENAVLLSERMKFVSSGPAQLVIRVAYVLDTNQILAVLHPEGELIAWDVANRQEVKTLSLGITSSKALDFSRSGHLLMGATEHLYLSGPNREAEEYVNGIGLWNTGTGDLVTCISHPCQGERPDQVTGNLGATIDSAGEWVIVYSEDAISELNLLTSSASSRILSDPDRGRENSIGAVAYDEQHNRHYLVFQEDRISVSTGIPLFPYRTIYHANETGLQTVGQATIDPTGHWLAHIRGNSLAILQLAGGKFRVLEGVTDPVAFSFDRRGTLLIVAARNKMIVLDLAKQNTVAVFDTPNIATLSVSDDNRVVLWGDSSGVIHLWTTEALDKPAK